jgi:hypothetical protein
MNKHQEIIIQAFKEKKELTADDLMPLLFYEEYDRANRRSEDPYISEEGKIIAIEEINQIRRRTLYYIKALENSNTIRLSRRGAKGKKYYSLENKTQLIYRETEKDYDNDINSFIIREENENWAKKYSSLLIEMEYIDEKAFMRMLGYSKSISDAISLNNPSLEKMSEEIELMIRRISEKDNITFSAIVQISKLKKNSIEEIKKLVEKIIRNNILLIISLENNDIKSHDSIKILTEIVDLIKTARAPIYIHNKDINNSPVFVGKLGPYSISEKDYTTITSVLKGNQKAFVVGMNNVLCDVDSFIGNHSISELRRALLLKGTDLFIASLNLRRKVSELLPESVFGNNVLDLGRDYYRFWNYGLKDPHSDQETVISLLKSAKETIGSYAHAQSTIYTSCGMPTPFKTAFSVMFEEKLPRNFSQSQFKKLIVKDIRDLMSKNIQDTLLLKQRASDIFNGGDRTRITKRNGNNTSEIIREISFMQKSYSIPLICYDFSHHEKELTLTDFIN